MFLGKANNLPSSSDLSAILGPELVARKKFRGNVENASLPAAPNFHITLCEGQSRHFPNSRPRKTALSNFDKVCNALSGVQHCVRSSSGWRERRGRRFCNNGEEDKKEKKAPFPLADDGDVTKGTPLLSLFYLFRSPSTTDGRGGNDDDDG